MTSKLRQVAEAIFIVDRFGTGGEPWQHLLRVNVWENLVPEETVWEDGRALEEGKDHFLDLSRAAISALREPSQEMIEAMKTCCWSTLTDNDAQAVWRAAIDTLLAEKET